MAFRERVIPDPFSGGSSYDLICFGCGISDRRRPSAPYKLKPNQIVLRAAVDTGDIPNPFKTLDASSPKTVLLCSECKHVRWGWQIICNRRKFGEAADSALKVWKTRCRGSSSWGLTRRCTVCSTMPGLSARQFSSAQRGQKNRNPSRDLKLYNLLCVEDMSVREKFVSEFCRLSKCDASCAFGMLSDPSEVYLCYLHMNHSRYARELAMRGWELEGEAAGFCEFWENGCTSPQSLAQGRLWRLPMIDVCSPDTLEAFLDLEDGASYHSDGTLHALDVMGRLVCRSCLYIVTGGRQGNRPPVSLRAMSSKLDLFMVRCVKFALAGPSVAEKSPIVTGKLPQSMSSVAQKLRNNCLTSNGDALNNVRMLPFMEVVRCRALLITDESGNEFAERKIDERTFEKRIESVLAREGIILRKLSYRLRCYICVEQIDQLLQAMAASASSSIYSSSRPSLIETRTHHEAVAARFEEKTSVYWSGRWSLSEEVAAVPAQLWLDVILQMASRKRVVAWTTAAKMHGMRLDSIFPASNSTGVLPQPSIEEHLRSSKDYSRGDLLLCVRALKVIEQMVFSRTNSVSGPLTISISVSGICEVSPSFVSVLNAVGVFLSYTVTERYRQRLIAERERDGPWDFNVVNDVAIPVLQFDNWDIKPLHAVKVDGKALPKVNGSLLQGQIRGSKRPLSEDGTPSKRPKLLGDSWKDAVCLGTREDFIDELTNTENSNVLRQFNNVVFGMVSLFRGQLVGGKEAAICEYNSGTTEDFIFGTDRAPINFRTMLLSCFKPHGGRPMGDESLYDQHVIYVEISRDSAADILTVRRFVNMVEEQIRPGESGRPRYVVFGGDQPSHRMICKLWVESLRAQRTRIVQGNQDVGAGNGTKSPLHEWMIPFPGFFHAEKQATNSMGRCIVQQLMSLLMTLYELGIIPASVSEELFYRKPGRMVMKLLSFSGYGRFAVDRWGFGYVHMDEALEMLIVRHLKSLSVNFFGHLENSAAWLMEVSMFRALTRYMTGASRAFGRKRDEGDGGESLGPLIQFDRNACQWKTVGRMLHVMRAAGFLNVQHLGSEWLTNVFSTPHKRMAIKADQDDLLDIASKGELTAKLHASVLFPEVFGPLTDSDRIEHFGGKKFKHWTKCRAVARPAKSMGKLGGVEFSAEGEHYLINTTAQDISTTFKRPRTRAAFSKALQDRRRSISKMKDALHHEQRHAMWNGDESYLREVMTRWDTLHAKRYLISPFADCFVNHDGQLNHAEKSRFLKYSARGNRDICYPLNDVISAPREARSGTAVSRSIFDFRIPTYDSLQLDVMNALHFRGDTGQRGTSLEDIVTGKMKKILRPWVTGPRAQRLKQLHLHIDDPNFVLAHKRAEQDRRDQSRVGREAQCDGIQQGSMGTSGGIAFDEDLNVPWVSLLTDRGYKDELASLHLFCGAVAAFELLQGTGLHCSVYLHGGSFALPSDFTKSTPSQFKPIRSPQHTRDAVMKGRVTLMRRVPDRNKTGDMFAVPRSRCVIFDTNGHATVGSADIRHGESETRFVAVTKQYVSPEVSKIHGGQGMGREGGGVSDDGRNVRNTECQTLIVSDDTDVFVILMSNPYMYGRGVLHVLNDTVHNLDLAIEALESIRTCGRSVAAMYCLAGCDFTPAIYGLRHDTFWPALKMFLTYGKSLVPPLLTRSEEVDFLFCILYLAKYGKSKFCTEGYRRRFITQEVDRGTLNAREIVSLRKSFFVSEEAVGSATWCVDVRNFVADNADTTNELLPHNAHIMLHCGRADFVVMKYWGRADDLDLSDVTVGPATEGQGYMKDGTIVLEEKKDVQTILGCIKSVIKCCNCKGNCSTRRCSCKKNSEKCIGCACTDGICKNRAATANPDERALNETETSEAQTGGGEMGIGLQLAEHAERDGAMNTEGEEWENMEREELSDSVSEDRSSRSSGQFEADDIEELV